MKASRATCQPQCPCEILDQDGTIFNSPGSGQPIVLLFEDIKQRQREGASSLLHLLCICTSSMSLQVDSSVGR